MTTPTQAASVSQTASASTISGVPNLSGAAHASIAMPAPAFARQQVDMRPCRDLMGGTPAMRAAAEAYIERGDASPEAFRSRLGRTVLLNAYRRTLNFLRGQVFQAPVMVGAAEDPLTPEAKAAFAAFAEDVDLRGANLTSWSGTAFRQGVQDGVTFAIVDHSAVETRKGPAGTEYRRANGTWARKTREADRLEGWRPYLIHIEAAQVLDARGRWVDGRYRTEHFRYRETITLPETANAAHTTWAQRTVQQIRAFDRDEATGIIHWALWRNNQDGNNQYLPVAQGTLSIPEIPVAVFMPGDPRSPWTAEPALIDLAWLNIRHWQVSSGHAELMEYVQRPVWFCAGTDLADTNGAPLAFGAGRLIVSPDAATLRNVGIDAASCAASRQELQALEENMALYGLQLLQPKTTKATATEVQRTSEENNSTLAAWTLGYQDFLENCLRLVALWWDLADGPSVALKTPNPQTTDMRLLLDMHQQNLLPTETLLAIAKSTGLLPE